ncbi:hypothetical protein [Rhodopirellula sp. MGV]|uniref:hypothetical protein n=1 Tax=Rhodopirellula sp. MGV TaxID=2023130 RepID=UPI000B95CA1F|nr:hypothetical protein [Rhodopirellula sp. MGV]OYP38532.1 hypothetical protein CGZ80_01965 [Rhodopirellula sp. MGV]PNY34821.1 hypothetical protein C2E31_21480 [Rhodopirellula baltica]
MRIRLFLPLLVALFCLPNFAEAAVVNGDFSSGDLTGWTVFRDANGILNGDPNSNDAPEVNLFDVTGNGESLAVQFRVGRDGFPVENAGGGISQTIETESGELSISVDIAVFSTGNNAQGGQFELSVNGVILETIDIGDMTVDQTIRDQLSGTVRVGQGSQQVQLAVRRIYSAGSAGTPVQYLDNIIATVSPVAIPEPTSAIFLASIGIPMFVRRRR